MVDPNATVRDYYDHDPQREWDRFSRHPFEFPITMHFLQKYLGAGSTILDIGGGPGRYALELTRRGHIVDLFDLSPKSIDLAKRLANAEGFPARNYIVGNAADLEQLKTGSYDVVLNLGPLYHLVQEADRKSSILESIRVLRPGGLLVVGFISSFAHIYHTLNDDQSRISERPGLSQRCLISRSYTSEEHFTDGFMIVPSEIETLMSQFPLEKLTIIGAEGVVAQSEQAIIKKGESTLNSWIELCKDIADTKEAISASIHITYFGRKTESLHI